MFSQASLTYISSLLNFKNCLQKPYLVKLLFIVISRCQSDWSESAEGITFTKASLKLNLEFESMPRNDVSYSRLNLLRSLHFKCVFKTKQIILPGFGLLMFLAFVWAE